MHTHTRTCTHTQTHCPLMFNTTDRTPIWHLSVCLSDSLSSVAFYHFSELSEREREREREKERVMEWERESKKEREWERERESGGEGEKEKGRESNRKWAWESHLRRTYRDVKRQSGRENINIYKRGGGDTKRLLKVIKLASTSPWRNAHITRT